MISKFKFSLITVIMLVLMGFVFQDQAIGQPDRGSLCPLAPYTTGYTDIEVSNPLLPLPPADFTAGVLGTVEANGADTVAGLDWMHAENFFEYDDIFWLDLVGGPLRGLGNFGKLPTNITGSQHVAPWNQNDGRNTYIQLTNAADKRLDFFFNPPIEVPVTVHVQVFDTNCQEIINFCDDYTGFDTHEYDLSNFVANDGQNVPNLLSGEGFVVMTPVKNCDSRDPNNPETAIDHNHLAGEFMIHDIDDYRYGAHTYARQSVCEPPRGCCPLGNLNSETGECDTVGADEPRISGCEVRIPGLPADQVADFCRENDAESEEDCLRRFLSAYVCVPVKYEEPFADGPGKLPGVCVPNEFHQGRPCESNDFPFNFCGLGGPDLPNGRCVLTAPGELLNGTCQIDEFCEEDEVGRPCLTGSEFARFERVRPDTLYGQFNILPANITAGSDLVLIDFSDQYIPFDVNPGFVNINKNIHNDLEEALSCGNEDVCYARFGIDEPIVISEEFAPPTPTPPPVTPTPIPTTTPEPTPTPIPTRTPNESSGSGSCAIAGSPVQLGTALANVLIPLVPVAFAFGIRAARRRKK